MTGYQINFYLYLTDMNRIWFFGCSLTYGSGLAAIDAPITSRWTSLVADRLNLKEENKGSPGASNEMILVELRDAYNSIHKNDTVILQTTFPGRTFGFVHQTDKPVRYNIVAPNPTLKYNLLHHGGKYEGKKFNIFHTDVSKKQHFEHTDDTIELMQSLSNYVADVKLPYVDKWKEHYRVEFNFYKELLEAKGVKTLYWDFDERFNYETIVKATKGKVKDYHFSVKGHEDFSERIVSELVAFD